MRVIAGTARSLKLDTLPGDDTRPTTDRIRETLFNMLAPDVPDARFLDLFSGSGAIGIEALSRGAKHADLVEMNPKACRIIEKNLTFTRLADRATVHCKDVKTILPFLKERYDIIFMDPPYDREHEKCVLELLADSPCADSDTTIIVEASIHTDFSYVEELGYTVNKEKKYKTNKHMFLKRR